MASCRWQNLLRVADDGLISTEIRCLRLGRFAPGQSVSLPSDRGLVSRQGTDARFLDLGWLAVHGQEKEGCLHVPCRTKTDPR